MGRPWKEYTRCRILAERYGLTDTEVKKVVDSFFSVLCHDAKRLPFDNPRRIYSCKGFQGFVTVRQIPFIGRIGPVYSKYLKWRANVSEQLVTAPRSSYRRRILQSDIEATAEAILSGSTPPPLEKKKGSELYERVWLVGQDGKKSARQVIPKKK